MIASRSHNSRPRRPLSSSEQACRASFRIVSSLQSHTRRTTGQLLHPHFSRHTLCAHHSRPCPWSHIRIAVPARWTDHKWNLSLHNLSLPSREQQQQALFSCLFLPHVSTSLLVQCQYSGHGGVRAAQKLKLAILGISLSALCCGQACASPSLLSLPPSNYSSIAAHHDGWTPPFFANRQQVCPSTFAWLSCAVPFQCARPTRVAQTRTRRAARRVWGPVLWLLHVSRLVVRP